MITCPNKSSQEWQNLVKEFGEIKAMYLFTLNNEVIPTVTEANEILNTSKENIKPGVSELFESNPKLANEVYEALGFTGNISLESNLKNTGKTEQELIEYLQKKYPEIKLNISNNPVWEQGDNVFNQEEYNNQINYRLKATKILLSDKAKQVFKNGEKNGWDLNKILTELQIPKEQKQLILNLGITDREQIALELASKYGYSVEVNTAIKEDKSRSSSYIEDFTLNGDVYSTEEVGNADFGGFDLPTKNGKVISDEEYKEAKNKYFKLNQVKTSYYSNLTVPGGTNYTENEISTPLITPSIKGHAQFSTDRGIGWFRSDEQMISEYPVSSGTNVIERNGKWIVTAPEIGDIDSFNTREEAFKFLNSETTKTRRILEVQSDLFQKGRDKKDLHDRIETVDYKGKQYHIVAEGNTSYFLSSVEPTGIAYTTPEDIDFDDEGRPYQSGGEDIPSFEEIEVPKSEIKSTNKQKNQFLQLLNKNNNWVTFFIKSIIQDSAKKGYEKVLFPKGETAAKIEGHETIADEIRKKDNEINALKPHYTIYIEGRTQNVKTIEEANQIVDTYNNTLDEDNPFSTKAYFKETEVTPDYKERIAKLEQEKTNLKSQGIEKLKPIEAFYEIKVGNILEKQFGKDNVKTITDEYGNQWREITINQARDLANILLQRNEANQIIGQANIKAMTVLVDAINKKADTIPHEYAHHYIAWFRNTPIVQEGIKRFGSEEALVQAIGEQVVKQKGEAYNWWKKFTNFIINLLSDKQLLQILTDSFLNRANLNTDFTYNKITPEQKQEAQQLYSQYLEQNPNGNVEGFKSWVNSNQSNVQYQLPPKKESETKERFIERMNSRIENGMYKERSGELVPITNTYNPETWWVEKIEKLVDFKTGVRKENLFTFDKVNKKLQSLVSKYSEEGYSFRRVNTYIPPVTTVRANPAPNNRAIWKIEVTKSLLGGKIQEAIINELDSDEANSDIEEKISDFFDNVENKDNVTIISELNKLEVSDEIKKLNDFLLSKLSLNPSLKIVISEEVNEKGFADYNVVTNTITIYRNNFIGKRANFETLAITFAHELLHSFTYRALINNSTSEEKEFYTVVKRLYNIAKKNTKFKNHIAYASKDSHGNVMNEATKLAEFLSYVFTLKDLQNELRPMKLNIWNRLIVAIKKFFGIKDITYDYVLNETISFINNGFEDIEVDIKKIKKLFKLQRSLEDDLYLQKEQPTHLKIWERLNNFANDFTVDRANNSYIHTKTNQKFVSNTEKMNSMKVTNAQLSDDPAIRAKQLAWRKKQIDIAEIINVTASSNLSKVAAKVAESNGLGQDESVVKYISHLLNKFKKPNVTILTNVLVADVNLLLADTIDMVVIDEQNKVHIFKFETRQYGFKDWETVTNYGGTIPYSDRQRVSYRLSAQVDYFERVTGKSPVTASVIMLHTPVVNNVITSIKLDVTNPKFPTGIDSLPYNSSVNSMYKDAEIKIGRTNDDMFSEDKIDVDTYDAIAEEEKERLKTHVSTSKQLTKREEIVNQSIEALIYKKQLIARRGKSYEIEKMDQMIEDLLAEKDTEKALIKILEFANREAERIWNEYQRYTKNDKEIPLNILYNWRDSVSAFDAIMNDEDGLESLLSREHGFKGGPKYRQTLRNTMNMISSIKGLYESLGMDRLVDFLAPNYNKLYAELKRNKQKEYRRKKFKGEIPTGLTEAEYVDKALDERAEDLDIRTKNLIRAELKKASRDIGVLTRWIDNLLDSTDPVTAAMVKGFAFADENSRIEALEKRDEFVLMVRKLEADFKKRNGRPPKSNEELYDFMLEKDDEGNLTGHYITHYKSEMITEYRQIIAVAKEFETAEQRKAYIKGWLNENNPLSTASFREAYLKFLEDEVNKENAILSEKAHRHILDNSYLKNKLSINQMMENNMLTEEEGSLISNWLSENTWVHRVPIRKWLNPQWSQLEKIVKDKNDVRGEFYNFIINTRNQADKFIPFAFRLDTRLPGIIKQNHERIKSGQSITQMTINSFKDDFTFRVDDTHRYQELTDESGNAKYFLPVHFTGRVTKDVKVITPEGVTETKTIFDPEEQSFDIAGIYYKYWTMANDYNHKSEILPKMELAKFMIEKRHAIKRDFKGNIIERTSSTVSGKLRKGSSVIINKTQLADQVHDWFLMCVYGQTESDAGKLGNLDLGKFIQFLNKYTAINLLGVNFIAGTANLILGETLQKIDVIAKEYVDHKSWFKADKWYLSHLRGTLGDIGARSPKNISTKLYEWMGVMDDYGKVDMDRKTRFAQLMHSDTLFFTSHVGEHYMQNRFGLAMLDNMRAYDDNGQDIGSILDMVQLDDKGKLTFDSRMNREKSKWTDKDMLIFKQKTRGILTRIHGEYSQLGKVAIERMAIGRMAYMFRKFIVPGFRRRWSREQYYERIGQFAEGNYITTGKFLGDIGGLIFGKTEENSEYSFLQRLISNLQSFKMSMLLEEWASLSDHEKANIVRTISEVGFLIIAIIIANIAMRFRGDADDPDEERFWSFLSYQAYRLQNELLFFTPKLDSAMSILRSPAASISVIENIIKLTGQIFHPLEVYKTGTWKGRPKILKTLMNMTPVERQFYRLRDVSDQVTWVQNAAFGDGGSGKMSAPTQ